MSLGRLYIFPDLHDASIVRSKGAVGRTPHEASMLHLRKKAFLDMVS